MGDTEGRSSSQAKSFAEEAEEPEMEALRQEVASLNTTVATLKARVDYNEKRIEAVAADGKQRSDEAELEMRRQFDKLDTRLDRFGEEMDKRIAGVVTIVTEQGHNLTEIKTEQKGLRHSVSNMEIEGQNNTRTMTRIETKVDALVTGKAVTEDRRFQWRAVLVPAIIAVVFAGVWAVLQAFLGPLAAKMIH